MRKLFKWYTFDGPYLLLGIILALSTIQLWYMVKGFGVIWASNPIPAVVTQILGQDAEQSDLGALYIAKPTETYLSSDQPEEKENISNLRPSSITITKINLDLPVVSVPLQNGTWKVYDYVANYAEGTSLIGKESGNVGLYGHDRDQAFRNIKLLSEGDTISVTTIEGYSVQYTVSESTITQPSDVNVFYPTDTPTLTLVTCDGIFSEKRYVVHARQTNISK
ncbi:sortase [candidate division WWE3 bacterium]|uniref:Sortase n=1 Tax=candidate division WWE3 bacterium TaxID=2053526 RepID=A0A955LGK7_UNCKA|nr:sortase [candidate division WWE3 bacterium]